MRHAPNHFLGGPKGRHIAPYRWRRNTRTNPARRRVNTIPSEAGHPCAGPTDLDPRFRYHRSRILHGHLWSFLAAGDNRPVVYGIAKERCRNKNGIFGMRVAGVERSEPPECNGLGARCSYLTSRPQPPKCSSYSVADPNTPDDLWVRRSN